MRAIQASSISFGLFLLFIAFIGQTNAQKCPSEEEIPCDNAQCILRKSWCDKKKDCADGSDEAYCKKVGRWSFNGDPNDCEENDNLFLCDNGQCFPNMIHCDGQYDCGDSSDENECETETSSTNDEDSVHTHETPTQITSDSWDSDRSDEVSPVFTTSDLVYSTERPSEDVVHHLDRDIDALVTDTFNLNVFPNNVISEDSDNRGEESIFSPITPKATPKQLQPPSPTTYYQNKMMKATTDTSKTAHFIPTHIREITSLQQRQTHPTHPAYIYPPPERLPTNRSHYLQPNYNNVSPPQHSQYPPVQPQQPQYTPFQPQYPVHPKRPPYPPAQPQRSQYPSVQSQYPPIQPQQSRYPPLQPQQQQNFNYRRDYNGNEHNSRRSDRIASDTSILTPQAYTGHYKAPSTFHFKKNYTLLYNNGPSIKRAYEWLLEIRDVKNGWGKDTPRALIALSLVNNSFAAGTHEIDMLKKYFQVYLSVKLLRPETINKNRLAIFTNALLATCQNPKDFHGIDLTELLRKKQYEINTDFAHPFIYLSLCLADAQLSVNELYTLQRRLQSRLYNYDQEKDMLSLAIMAYACHMQHVVSLSADQAYRTHLEEILNNAISKLLEFRQSDGSFGSVYSTALAAQALLSVNDSRNWDLEATFDFLKERQTNNGSFGDLLATYYVLPVLSGRSLLHLRNTHCNPLTSDRELTPVEILDYIGPRQYIRYSLHFGVPLTNSYAVDVLVPIGINFFDVMRVAEYQNDHFRFSYEIGDDRINIFSISNLPNDAEKGFAWHLYIKKDFGANASHINIQELFTGDIRKLFPTADQHFILWYHPIAYRG